MKRLNKKKLILWLKEMRKLGNTDSSFELSVFDETRNRDLIICAGWIDGFAKNDKFTLISKSSPTYGLCVKIGINQLNNVYNYYEGINMPYCLDGNEIYDTEISFRPDYLVSEKEEEDMATWLLDTYYWLSKNTKEWLKK